MTFYNVSKRCRRIIDVTDVDKLRIDIVPIENMLDVYNKISDIDDNLKILLNNLDISKLRQLTENNMDELLDCVSGNRKAISVLQNIDCSTYHIAFTISLLFYCGFNEYPFQFYQNYKIQLANEEYLIRDFLIKYNNKEAIIVFVNDSINRHYDLIWSMFVAALSVRTKTKNKNDNDDIVVNGIYIGYDFEFYKCKMPSSYADEYLAYKEGTSRVEITQFPPEDGRLVFKNVDDREKILKILNELKLYIR